MKPFYVTHALWLVIACVAFFVGQERIFFGEGKDVGVGEKFSAEKSLLNREHGLAKTSERPLENVRLRQLSIDDLKILIEEITAESDLLKRRDLISILVKSMTKANAAEIYAAWRQSGVESNLGEQITLSYMWGRLDGKAALEEMLSDKAQYDHSSGNSIIRGWMETDPDGVKQWINDNFKYHSSFAETVVEVLLQRSTEEATEYALSLPSKKGNLMETIARAKLADGDSTESAIKWADALPEGEEKVRALRRIAEEWAEEKPEEALKWVLQIKDKKAQVESMRVSMREWARRDLQAAGEFINQLEAGEMRDNAVISYTRYAHKKSPATGMEWAQTIDNPTYRRSVMKAVAGNWLRKDEAAARGWIKSAELSPELREALLDGNDD